MMRTLHKWTALVTVTVLIALGGCAQKPKPQQDSSPNQPDMDARLLWDADWAYRDHNIGEDILIHFGEDGSYVYRCDCGEPVGNSDIYDSYTYDAEEKTITLMGGSDRDWIRVLYADNNYLCLEFSDGVVSFRNRDSGIDDSVRKCARQYIPSDAILCLSILGYADGSLTVAPYEYDADAADRWKDTVTTLPAADDIAFTSISVTVEDGQEEMLAVTLSESDQADIGEFYTSGFLKLDKRGTVTAVYFYGETIVENGTVGEN